MASPAFSSETVSVMDRAAIRVRAFRDSDAAAWDAFVNQSQFGSPFHLTAWKRSIEETFRYKPYYLIAEEHGDICGVLPLFAVSSILSGKALLSIPFAVYGGAIADSDVVLEILAKEAERLGREMNVDYIELRNGYEEQRLHWTPVSRYVTFTQEIEPEEAAILEKIPRKTRRMVRKSLEQSFSSIDQQSSAAFEELYHASLRRLGTPSFPSNHFSTLLRNFGSAASIREIKQGEKVIAAVLSFYFRDQVLPYYGASDGAFNHLAPNNFMYFDLMRSAAARGYRRFDFGRSKKGIKGSYDFKSHWGMVERDLPYEMLLIRRKELPHVSPANPVFSLPRKIWSKLPLRVTKTIGPYLVRLVP